MLCVVVTQTPIPPMPYQYDVICGQTLEKESQLTFVKDRDIDLLTPRVLNISL